MEKDINSNGSVLIIDDNALTLNSLKLFLEKRGYSCFACYDPVKAINIYKNSSFDVVLTDVNMPQISGLEVLEEIQRIDPEKPVIVMTAYAEMETAIDAIEKGAFNFVTKPFSPDHLTNAIKKAVKYAKHREIEKDYKRELEHSVQQKTEEAISAFKQMKNMNIEVIQRLTKVAEYRDTETGNHISRIGLYSSSLAKELCMSEDFVDQITFASSMHDIGKIGMPDSILLKPGPLTTEEFSIMKTHTTIGENMREVSSHCIIQMAALIALSHHERWDGTGYPSGLKGDDVPVEGMIVMVADQYDALRNKRPYKEPLSHEEAYKIITEGDGRTEPGHFNPDILNAFIKAAPAFDEIFNSMTNDNESDHFQSEKDKNTCEKVCLHYDLSTERI